MPSHSFNFVHHHVHSEFSFLDGASHLENLVQVAAEDNQTALALTDHNNLCGAPSFLNLCRSNKIKPIFGSELTLDTGHVTALAMNRKGYANLCRLLTKAHLNNQRNNPCLSESMLLESGEGLIILSGCYNSPLAVLLRQRRFDAAKAWVKSFKKFFFGNFFIEIQRTFEPFQEHLNSHLVKLAREFDVQIVATNNVHYAAKKSFAAQDLLTCIRYLIKLDDPHVHRKINAELYLKSQQRMCKLFSDIPEAISNTARIAEVCEEYEISESRFMPRFTTGDLTNQALHELTYAGANRRYESISFALKSRIEYELRIIAELGFSDYFLVVHDLVQFAKQRKIRHAGRGSAADSVVSYCLDITKVDSFARNLRFERFINPERANNLPDIDVDFDSRYRDDVTNYVTDKYGKDHVATVCTFARFRARSAIRDVAKALGFETEDIDKMAKMAHWSSPAGGIRRNMEVRPEMRHLNIPQEKYKLLFDLCAELDDLPRHVSTHLGGVVITGDPITEISPLQMAAKGCQVIQYDKDGVEDLGLLKLDLLSLRTLGAVEDSVAMISSKDAKFDLDKIALDDPETFELIRTGDTAGAFQIESPAQQSMHPRLNTSTYEDIVASVALIRPGPVKGEMVEPYIARRIGKEKITSIHPAIDKILEHTYGVVLFQEQVISIAVELGGFTPGQADVLRRTISKHRSGDKMIEIGKVFVKQAVGRGIDQDTAEKVFSWLQGYAGFGFCEAHAAAFGDTAYRTAYLLKHYPAEFYAAILNNYPMGFFSQRTIVNEARIRSILTLGPDINVSEEGFTVQNGSIRVGLKQVKGISAKDIGSVLANRPYKSWQDFVKRCQTSKDVLENLVLCGAFDSVYSNRRTILYGLGSVFSKTGELDLSSTMESTNVVNDFSLADRFWHEYEILSFSPNYHPIEFIRNFLNSKKIYSTREAKEHKDKKTILRVAGMVVRPHTPPTKSGALVCFLSLEDETGLLNITAFPNTFQRYGHLIYNNPMVIIEGKKDWRESNSLVAERIWKIPKGKASA